MEYRPRSSAGSGTGAPEPQGLIFAFDLDNTIIGMYQQRTRNTDIQTYIQSIDASFNERCLQILFEAARSKKKEAIFLLTNNGDPLFIADVIEVLNYKYIEKNSLASNTNLTNLNRVFDAVLMRNGFLNLATGEITDSPKRTRRSVNPSKKLEDIQSLLTHIGKAPTTAEQVYFFDDRGDHLIRQQIPPRNYIQITPPFEIYSGKDDITDYSSVEEALRTVVANANLRGGRIALANAKKRKRVKTKTRKIKRRSRQINARTHLN